MQKLLGFIIAGIAIVSGGWISGTTYEHAIQKSAPTFGSFNPTGGGTYRLGQSVGTTNSSIKLASFKEPVSNISYTMSYLNTSIGYGTLDPQTSRSEFVSFSGITQNSDGSATLTGVARGLTRSPAGSACTASTTLAEAHPGQSIFILSDSPCLFQEYYVLRNVSTSTNTLVFSSTTPPQYDKDLSTSMWSTATGTTFVDLYKLQSTALAGTVNATLAINGVVQIATARQAASSTILGSTGAALVISASSSTDTPQMGCAFNYSATPGAGCNVFADLTGHIRQAWIDLTATFNFTGKIGLGTSSPYTSFGIVSSLPAVFGTIYATSTVANAPSNATSTFDGNINVGSNASTSNLYITNTCTHCLNGYATTSGNIAGPTTGTSVTGSATCAAGKVAVSGGIYDNGGFALAASIYQANTTTWQFVVNCTSGSCSANTAFYNIDCVNP